MFLCRSKVTNIADSPEYLTGNYFGQGRKSLTEDMVCFQQSATAYLNYYKASNMHQPWKSKQIQVNGDELLLQHELRLQKYLDRMYEVVQCRSKKYQAAAEDAIFGELDQVIAAQLHMESRISPQEANEIYEDLSKDFPDSKANTGIPLVDIILNISLFTAHFEDRNKVLRIIKELFNHCTTMKRLLHQHGKLILAVLIRKYDKQCHLYSNKALHENSRKRGGSAIKQ